MPLSLLDLSIELLWEIGCKLDQGGTASLRASCRRLRDAMEHMFFSCLVLSTHQLHSTDGLEFLTALAGNKTGWSTLAKTLHIKLGKRPERFQKLVTSDTQMQAFRAALAAIRNVNMVRWETSQGDPEWERTTFCEYLNALPMLDELQLEIQGDGVNLSLPVLSRVRKLKIKRLEVIIFGVRHLVSLSYTPATPLIHEISQQVTPILTAVHLNFTHWWANAKWESLWSLLQGRPIHLTEINTSIVTPSLIAYLASYSGLRTLTLTADKSAAASDRLADMFYETALAPHASTLVVLSCSAVHEGRWSFGPHNAPHIAALRNLTSLEMSVNAGRTRTIEPSQEQYSWLMPADTKHLVLRVEVEQADIDPVVAELLRTAANLPALRSLAIRPADAEENRGCVRERVSHRRGVKLAIKRAVRKFSCDIPRAVVVQTGNNTYHCRAAATNHRGYDQVDPESMVPD
ncbi:hypothetical protein DFH06DRAFT_1153305 [Mycena polygramma]|nr:hypothetical protein DFH06DRAFT_1153305 [Mycena polygramma]